MNRNLRGDGIEVLLRALKLPAFVAYHEEVAEQAEKQGWSFKQYLYRLAEQELEERKQRKIDRLTRQSKLPGEKTLATFDLSRMPNKIRKQTPTLCEGNFLKRAENILAFGLPGRGKSHLVCGIGHELIKRGYKVLFLPAYRLVQNLLCHRRSSRNPPMAMGAEPTYGGRGVVILRDSVYPAYPAQGFINQYPAYPARRRRTSLCVWYGP